MYKGHKINLSNTIDSKLYTLSRSVSKMISYGKSANEEKTKILTKLLDGIVD